MGLMDHAEVDWLNSESMSSSMAASSSRAFGAALSIDSTKDGAARSGGGGKGGGGGGGVDGGGPKSIGIDMSGGGGTDSSLPSTSSAASSFSLFCENARLLTPFCRLILAKNRVRLLAARILERSGDGCVHVSTVLLRNCTSVCNGRGW